jgi:cystathionine beta-lyase family protein involved in aluminum resistance
MPLIKIQRDEARWKVSDVFRTKDLNLSAALMAEGHELQDVGRDELGRCVFLFRDSPTLRRTRLSFINGTHPAVALLRSRDALLDEIHSGA